MERKWASDLEDGFPYRVFPTGWFQVAWSDELRPGDVRTLRYFDTELVMFRGEDGTAAVLNAHCPHMGAHLGYGGRVKDCTIVCPFHGWQWDANGNNALVPSEGTARSRPVLGAWDVRETNGIVWLWYDQAHRPPMWDPVAERRHEQDFLPVMPGCALKWENVHARPQYMIENVVDLDHFPWVHLNESNPEITELRDQGHMLSVDMRTVHGYGRERTWATPNGPVETIMTTDIYGLATIFTDWGAGTDDSLMISNMTPIDHQHLDMFVTVLVKQDPESQNQDMPEGRSLRRIEQQRKQTDRDMPIWNNLVYNGRPPYARNEAKLMVQVKQWLRRFYEPEELLQALALAPASEASPVAVPAG